MIKEHIPMIVAAIDGAVPGSFQAVNCGTFTYRQTSKE
jgi:hypothetical protein